MKIENKKQTEEEAKIENILPSKKINEIKASKLAIMPSWEDLKKEYDPKLHKVVTDKNILRDKVVGGVPDYSARVMYGLQRLSTRRMTQMGFAIPVQRIYNTEGDPVKEAQAEAIEKIYQQVGIDSINIDRMHAYFASCEVATVWYPTKSRNNLYGFPSDYKLRCITYSPMEEKYSRLSEAEIYPVFDKYKDLKTLGFEFVVKEGGKNVRYFQIYEADKDELYRFDKDWVLEEGSELPIPKIPSVYWSRPMPIWEDLTDTVTEIELSLSRESNILKKNSAPILGVKGRLVGDTPAGDTAREVYQMQDGGDIAYITWSQQIDAMKFYIETLKQQAAEELQLPNLSLENVKSLGAISGEARKTLLTDPHLKVGYEAGAIIKGFERETNVIKEFLARMNTKWAESIHGLEVSHFITPFIQNDETAEVAKLVQATGKSIMSQKTAISQLGLVDNVQEEYDQLLAEQDRENSFSMFEPTNTASFDAPTRGAEEEDEEDN